MTKLSERVRKGGGTSTIASFLLLFYLLMLLACDKDNEKPIRTETLFSLLSPDETGIDFQNIVVEDERHNHLINDMIVAGAGVAVGDINNDSLPDLFFAGNQVPDRLYVNKGNLQFEDISAASGINLDHTWSAGVTMADVNNDGYLDIYVCKSVQETPQLSKNLLFINNGDLTFSEKAAEYGLSDRGFSVQAAFFDADNDGFLDLYLVNQPPSLGKRSGAVPNRLNARTMVYSDKLYWNNGQGTFRDVTFEAGVLNLGYGLSATVGDFNNDGWNDIYVTNDFDRPDHLYFNQGDGTFKNVINQAVKHISNFSMGSDAADYDNDGLLDIMVVDMIAEDHKRIKTNMGGMEPKDFWKTVNNGWHYQYMFNTLQRNNGNSTFSEVAHLAGVSNTDWSWSPLLADLDNDGWKDLFVTNGIKRNQRFTDLENRITAKLDSLELVAEAQGKKLDEVIDVMDFVDMAPADKVANYLFKNNGDLTFDKKSNEWGALEQTFSFGSAYADLDLDGDLDLVVNNMDDYASIYRNHSVEREKTNYLRILVVNKVGSPAYGAKVKLYEGESIWQYQELTNVRGYMSKSEDVLHFGLGGAKEVEKIKVIWPDGKITIKTHLQANQMLQIGPSDAEPMEQGTVSQPKLFADVTKTLQIDHRHKENNFNDYNREILLPHKMSNFGPGLAVGDLNGDGLDDFYVGGAKDYAGAIFVQKVDNTFEKSNQSIWENEKMYEDLGAILFDADGDDDLDLYVVSGGNEFEKNAPELQDRIYLNNGRGNFERSIEALPQMFTSGSCVVPGDIDKDGDLDLFVGGRLVPGNYPQPARSYILNNDQGRFTDITNEIAPMLQQAGLVTSAVWTDFNGDSLMDLALVGEWMPVTLLENQKGRFIDVTESHGLAGKVGWFYSIISEDFDRDGDKDFVVGNLGLNYKYKASEDEPFEIYYHDFDDNGQLDIVLSYYEQGESFPVRGRSCSAQQVPELKEKFPTFESFGDANLRDVYGSELDQAINYRATSFASAYIENLGGGDFLFKPLPNQAQLSSINNILAKDFDQDGHLDILTSGNLYASEIETPRNDAGMGLLLNGDGHGNFMPVPLSESGFFAPHDAKDMKLITVGTDKEPVLLVVNNNYRIQAIKWIYTGAKLSGDLLTIK
ncbi:MAG: FG-GAP-like repeat-containing protein [Cyclobacteriaceae bacterium]